MTPGELEKAMLTPASVFLAPERVVESQELTREQKIEILLRWQYDAAEEAVADEEGMSGKESDLLRRIVLALNELAGPLDLERVGPTKLHGISRDDIAKRSRTGRSHSDHCGTGAAHRSETSCVLPDLTPDIYSHWRASEIGATTERLERQLMLERIGDVSGKRVLEIGCGDGELAVLLAKRGAIVSAIDISEMMLAAARKRASAENVAVDFAVASAQELPYAENSFDIVVAVTILCFVRDASPVFQEIARVLRPGGRLVIGELGAWSTWAMGRHMRAWLGSKLWHRGVFRTPAGFRRLAIAAGLTPQAVRGAVYYPRVRWLMRLMAPHDRTFSRITSIGAAFLTFEATKPHEKVQP